MGLSSSPGFIKEALKAIKIKADELQKGNQNVSLWFNHERNLWNGQENVTLDIQ